MADETISCPRCERALKVPERLFGRKVKCPGCSQVFLAESAVEVVQDVEIVDEEPATPAPRPRPAARPRRLQRSDLDEDDSDRDDDDYEDRPRPRRRRSKRRAAQALAGPAIGLIVVGALGIVCVFLGIANALLRHTAGPAANGVPPEQATAYAAGMWAAIIFGACWSGAVLIGGFKMKDAENEGSVRTAAIVAMIPCSLAWVIGLPIGIWALCVLARPEVKRAFRR